MVIYNHKKQKKHLEIIQKVKKLINLSKNKKCKKNFGKISDKKNF